jgi:4-carboxymuconolactone decarboxylase
VESYRGTLWKLAIGDDAYFETVLARESANLAESGLDSKTHALVQLTSLIALDASSPSYLLAVASARAVGTSTEEIVGCLVASIPVLGTARVISAAPKLGIALGYDFAAAVEDVGAPPQV